MESRLKMVNKMYCILWDSLLVEHDSIQLVKSRISKNFKKFQNITVDLFLNFWFCLKYKAENILQSKHRISNEMFIFLLEYTLNPFLSVCSIVSMSKQTLYKLHVQSLMLPVIMILLILFASKFLYLSSAGAFYLKFQKNFNYYHCTFTLTGYQWGLKPFITQASGCGVL